MSSLSVGLLTVLSVGGTADPIRWLVTEHRERNGMCYVGRFREEAPCHGL
jgi:hypothetical protein